MAFTADPQYARICEPPGQTCTNETADQYETSKKRISGQYKAISGLRFNEAPVKAMVINGDITDFGHDDGEKKELSTMKSLLKEINFDIGVFPGLGNHDYEQNRDRCGANGCVRNMVKWMHESIKNNPHIVAHDNRDYTKWVKGRKTHFYVGSMAYTFMIGNTMFFQHHNYPSYTLDLTGYNGSKAIVEHIQVTSSMDWFGDQVRPARAKGYSVVVNLHDFVEHFPADQKARFVKDCAENQVTAIFGGHIHRDVGLMDQDRVPFFECGSAIDELFLLVCLDSAKGTLWYQSCSTNESGDCSPINGGWQSIPLLT